MMASNRTPLRDFYGSSSRGHSSQTHIQSRRMPTTSSTPTSHFRGQITRGSGLFEFGQGDVIGTHDNYNEQHPGYFEGMHGSDEEIFSEHSASTGRSSQCSPFTPIHSSNNSDISVDAYDFETPLIKQVVSLLQSQSKRIDEILKAQHKLKEELDNFIQFDDTGKLKRPKGKKAVTRILTNRINIVHESLPEQLKADESSTTKHNKQVMQTLVDEVLKDPENSYDKETVALAVKRKYEAERRSMKEDEMGDEIRKKRLKKVKYEQRKQRTYERRKSVITQKEKGFFSQLTKDYMSDESDSCDTDDTIVVHKHSWRSEKFNKWMEELDARYKAKLSKQSSATPPKKRKIGKPSESTPPTPLVHWAVDQDWLKKVGTMSDEATVSSKEDDNVEPLKCNEFSFDDEN